MKSRSLPRWLLAALLQLLTLPLTALAAPVDIAVGREFFTWQEFADGGRVTLKESGTRLFVTLEGENRVVEGWTYGFRGRLYSGSVDCAGTLKSGAECRYQSDYDGVIGTVDFTSHFRRQDGDYSDWGIRFGLGGEEWRHHLSGGNGYTESYSVVFGRLGIAHTPLQGWFAEAGLKYPFSISERLELYDGAKLTPQGGFSLFATAGYNFNNRWLLRAYYDSYRFRSSDTVTLTKEGVSVTTVSQSQAEMDTVGLSAGLYF